MQQRDPQDKKRITLWIAVGSTMAVIVMLWIVQLPSQMERLKQESAGPLTRWMVERQPQSDEPPPTFKEVMEDQRKQLEEVEKRMRDAMPAANVNAANVNAAAEAPAENVNTKVEPE